MAHILWGVRALRIYVNQRERGGGGLRRWAGKCSLLKLANHHKQPNTDISRLSADFPQANLILPTGPMSKTKCNTELDLLK